MKKSFLVGLLVMITCFANAQKKYVIVPKKFSFQVRKNQYKLNRNAKEFFEKEGFTTYYDDELPENFDKCSAYIISLDKKSKARSQSLWVLINDCNKNLVIKSKEGKSRLLEVSRSYNEALDKALKSIKNETLATVSSEKKQVTVKGLESLKQKSIYSFKKKTDKTWVLVSKENTDIELTCLLTSQDDVLIAKRNNLNGVLLKQNNAWFFEYYLNDELQSERIEIR
ncbi:hypothetical protein ACXGQW_07695 [Wenyingzhuangia sp. IMCC45533]